MVLKTDFLICRGPHEEPPKKNQCCTKIKILRELLDNDVSITDLAEKYNNIHPNVISRWNKELFEGAVAIFNKERQSGDKRKEAKITKLEETLQKRDTFTIDPLYQLPR